MPDELIPNRNPFKGIASAIIGGAIVVNGPVMMSILGTSWLGNSRWGPVGAIIGVVAGAAVGWIWWAFMVPRWRAWALARVTDASRLHRWAIGFGIEWPQGSFFEKTEFRPRK